MITVLVLLALATSHVKATGSSCSVDEWDNIKNDDENPSVCIDSSSECGRLTANCDNAYIAKRCACTCEHYVCGGGPVPTPDPTPPPVEISGACSNFEGTDESCDRLSKLRLGCDDGTTNCNTNVGWYCRNHPTVIEKCQRSCELCTPEGMVSTEPDTQASVDPAEPDTPEPVTPEPDTPEPDTPEPPVVGSCSEFNSKKQCKKAGKDLNCVYLKNSKSCVEATCETMSNSKKNCKKMDGCVYAKAGDIFEEDTCFDVANPPEHDCSALEGKKKCKKNKTGGLCKYSNKEKACLSA